MYDKLFLDWIYQRLIHVHGEDCSIDYMLKFKSIINAMDANKLTPNTSPPTGDIIIDTIYKINYPSGVLVGYVYRGYFDNNLNALKNYIKEAYLKNADNFKIVIANKPTSTYWIEVTKS